MLAACCNRILCAHTPLLGSFVSSFRRRTEAQNKRPRRGRAGAKTRRPSPSHITPFRLAQKQVGPVVSAHQQVRYASTVTPRPISEVTPRRVVKRKRKPRATNSASNNNQRQKSVAGRTRIKLNLELMYQYWE
jgi:hypothetical protein